MIITLGYIVANSGCTWISSLVRFNRPSSVSKSLFNTKRSKNSLIMNNLEDHTHGVRSGNTGPCVEKVGSSDVIIVGAGVAGSALANSLGKDGRQVHVIERELREPNRIIGEWLQPGGYLKLIELGIEDCVDEIDAQRVFGYVVYNDGKKTKLDFPLQNYDYDVAGRIFHNGRFIQRMREKAMSLPNVKLEQGIVTSLVEHNGSIKGVHYRTKSGQEFIANAPLTIVCDGSFSNLRHYLCNPKVDVDSYSVGLILKNFDLPYPNYAHLIIGDHSPIVFYPISSTEIRCFIYVIGSKPPSTASGEMASYLKNVVAPLIPKEFYNYFIASIEEGKIRCMANRCMGASQVGRDGAVLMGDALNMRHSLTGAGMTAVLCDVVVLRDLLRPLPHFHDASALRKCLQSFYTLRKPMASTINIIAAASYKLIGASTDPTMKEMVALCLNYMRLGGIFSEAPMAIVSYLSPNPSSLALDLCAMPIYSVAHFLMPFPSPQRLWNAAKLISNASSILLPIIEAELKE